MSNVFLITGATGDIGKELCLSIAKKYHKKELPCHLILTARTEEDLKNLSILIQNSYPGTKVSYKSTDFSNIETYIGIEALIPPEGLDRLIIMPPRAPHMDKKLDYIAKKIMSDQTHSTCVSGPVALIDYLHNELLKPRLANSQAFSRVILISGASSVEPIKDEELINQMRTAWVGIMKSRAIEFGPMGVIYQTVSLGQVITENFLQKISKEAISNHTTQEAELAKRTAKVPLQQYADLKSTVKLLKFYIDSEGASITTGENIVSNNGFRHGY